MAKISEKKAVDKKSANKKLSSKKKVGKKPNQFDYPMPSVKYSQGPTLDPMLVRGGATVVIEFPEMLTSEKFTVYFEGPVPGANPVIAPQFGSPTGHLEFFIPASVIGLCIGHTVYIFYTVEQHGVILGHSLELDLTIMPLSPSHPDVPGVYLVEAGSGENLDLETFNGNANAMLVPYPFIESDQLVWCRVDGTAHGGQLVSLWVITAYHVKAYEVRNGFEFQIPRSFLSELENYSSIDVIFFVKYDKSPSLQLPPVQELRVTTKGLRQSTRYSFYDRTAFEFAHLNGWEAGSAIKDPRDFVIVRTADDWYAHFYTYTNDAGGVLLEKLYTRLVVGQKYLFYIQVQRANSFYTVPVLSLSADATQHTPNTPFPNQTIKELKLEFVATSSSMTLKAHSHEASGRGNDFNIWEMVVRSI